MASTDALRPVSILRLNRAELSDLHHDSRGPHPKAKGTFPKRSGSIFGAPAANFPRKLLYIFHCGFAFVPRLDCNFSWLPEPAELVAMPSTKQHAPVTVAALALIGCSAVMGQIVLMRELIVVFNGNEISLGIMLATWLFWTAVGSGPIGGFVLGGNGPRRAVVVLECLQGLSLPPTIWALRASRTLFQTVPGELVGPVPMLLTSLACLSVFCTLSGLLFVAATRMYAQERGVSARDSTSSAYLLEAAGAGVGGVLADVLLLCPFNAFQMIIHLTQKQISESL
jgi:hypothetical protein